DWSVVCFMPRHLEGIFPLNVNSYFGDSGYAELIDTRLAGHVRALRRFADADGWAQVVEAIDHLDLQPNNAMAVLEEVRGFALPETRRMIERMAEDDAKLRAAAIWDAIYPRIKAVARSRFETGHLANAVEAASKELNSVVKDHVKQLTGQEYDGANLMRKAFTPNAPVVRIGDLATDSSRNFQQGFMEIFAGAMTAIRNPHAHAKLEVDRPRAVPAPSSAVVLARRSPRRGC
ncbi:MAG: TIGR02391 family protein, partial [Gammaproteobacteria bacterium]